MQVKYKHIQFDWVNGRWYCYTSDGKTDLGQVYYDPIWKGFVWEQADRVRFSISCLKDLISFLEQLPFPCETCGGTRRMPESKVIDGESTSQNCLHRPECDINIVNHECKCTCDGPKPMLCPDCEE